MQPTNKVIHLEDFKRESTREIIDDIGARAFIFLRDAAEAMDVPIKQVLVEHMLGLSLVMTAVEGREETERVLRKISQQLHLESD